MMGSYGGTDQLKNLKDDWKRRQDLIKMKYPYLPSSEREMRMQLDEMAARLRRIEELLEKKP